MGRAGAGAWSVEAIEAAVGLHYRGAMFERRVDLGEAACEFLGGKLRGGPVHALNRSRHPALREAAVEQSRELVYVALGDIQRRRDTQHVAIQAALSHHDTVLARGLHELRGFDRG